MRRAEDDNAPVSTGTLFFRSEPVRLLFDSGATHSFIAENCVDRIGLACDLECEPFVVRLPNGDKLIGTRGLKEFPISIGGREWMVDLIAIGMLHYDIILGMDWLSRHGAVMDFRKKTFTVRTDEGAVYVFKGHDPRDSGRLISAMTAARLLRQGCAGYVCYALEEGNDDVNLNDISVVREYLDVFPEKLTDLPPSRDVDFAI
jgi:hypothetical protein